MNCLLLVGIIISLALAGNCGVYSNGCERLPGFSWSSISEYKVSCSFNGYVKKIEKTIDFYADSECNEKSFITNKYSYSLGESSGENADNGVYKIKLEKATIKSSDTDTLASRKVVCTPAIKEGKTYSLKDMTCKLFVADLWAVYRDSLDKEVEGDVIFEGSEESRTMFFPRDSLKKYTKVSNFLGCWEWWSITLLILGIIVVIILIVVITISVSKKKSKKMPKRK